MHNTITNEMKTNLTRERLNIFAFVCSRDQTTQNHLSVTTLIDARSK